MPLFKPNIFGGGSTQPGRLHQYDISTDGRFLINISTEEQSGVPITVILNLPALTK